jgi:hypothetical protein
MPTSSPIGHMNPRISVPRLRQLAAEIGGIASMGRP